MSTVAPPKIRQEFAITLLVKIGDPRTKSLFYSQVSEAQRTGLNVLNNHVKIKNIKEVDSVQATSALTKNFFSNNEKSKRGMILVSDQLVADDEKRSLEFSEKYEPQKWVGGFRHEYSDQLVALIGVTPHVDQRVADIDQLIQPDFKDPSMESILKRAIGALIYKTPPPPKDESRKAEIKNYMEIRLLSTPSELRNYFHLRHQVYSILGYLSVSLEGCDSQLEIDGCDQYSLHIGAFFRETLVGTARIIASEYPDRNVAQIVNELASEDLDVEENMNRVIQVGLPVFQSNPINSRVAELNIKNRKYGELSRVIVHWDYRGAGISNQIMEYSIGQAIEYGFSTLFLECLEIHQKYYEKHGFKRVPGMHFRRVVHIDKKVIAMERNFN